MSLEAWGDDDGAGDYDHLLEAGWLTGEQANELEAERDELLAYAAFLQAQSTLKPDFGAWTPGEAVTWVKKVVSGEFHRLAWTRNDTTTFDACKAAVITAKTETTS